MELIAHTDGGSRGNPGPAGIGVVIRSSIHRAEIYEYIGERTNNYAEYAALLRACEYARTFKATSLHVFSDSKLIVQQMNGDWSVKHAELQDLHLQATKTISYNFSIAHIRREGNTQADTLANKAMDDARESGNKWLFSNKHTCSICSLNPRLYAGGTELNQDAVMMAMSLRCRTCKEFTNL